MVAMMITQPTFDTLTDDDCWQAVTNRDRRYDGVFVSGVRSTGIYCRPSCPARTPGRHNVTFYPDAQAAQSAGFRACKRCTPDTYASDVQIVEQACRVIEAHENRAPSLTELGAAVSMSPAHLQKVFKKVTGISPRDYAEMCRLSAFKEALRNAGSVTEALYQAGYGSVSTVYDRVQDQLGMPPTVYRDGGRGMHIGYTVIDCYLGRLLVAATERGICAVSIAEQDDQLESTLNADYPAAHITRDDNMLTEQAAAVLAHLDGAHPEVSLDIQATAFQRRAWAALQAIPRGETRSYSELADELGIKDGARAVARACATNPVPIIIPCHRVVRQDGSLGGYRWGLPIKERILEREQELIDA